MSSTTAQPSPVSAYLSGHIPLARVFWLYGVVGVFVLGFVVELLGALSPGLRQLVAAVLLVHLLAWYVALWQSAGRYTGPALWKWAARGAVLLPLVGLMLAVGISASKKPAPSQAAAVQVPQEGSTPVLKPFYGKLDSEK